MTALSNSASTAIAYDSLNSTLAETGWRTEFVTNDQGQEKILYFPLTEAEFLHPQEGYHLPSNTFHENTRTEIKEILQRRYAQREDAGVFGDLIIKWGIEGLEDHCPDVTVVFGLCQKEAYRSEFIVSAEGTKPEVVMEVVSPRYRKADREIKVKEYAQAGVEEYLIIDRRRQRGQLLDEVLGYRLKAGRYQPISPNEEGRIYCQALDLWIGLFEGKIILCEGATGEPLPNAQALEQIADQERWRAEQERERAEQEHLRAEQERERAERLAERLRQLGINPDQV